MQYLVHKSDLVDLTAVPASARADYVLVRTVTDLERLRALEEAVPEMVTALSALNSGLVVLSEQIEGVNSKIKRKRGG